MIEEIKCENIFCLKIKENIKKDDFLIVNNIGKNMLISDCEELKIGDRVLVVYTTLKTHIVRPAETIKSIAEKYGTSEEDIMIKNNIKQIFVGQQLFI